MIKKLILGLTLCAAISVGMAVVLDHRARNQEVDVQMVLENFFKTEAYYTEIIYNDKLVLETYFDDFYYQSEVGLMKVNSANNPIEFQLLERSLFYNEERDRWQIMETGSQFTPGSPSQILSTDAEGALQYNWQTGKKDIVCAELELNNDCIVKVAINDDQEYRLYINARDGAIKAITVTSPDLDAEYRFYQINSLDINLSGLLEQTISEFDE